MTRKEPRRPAAWLHSTVMLGTLGVALTLLFAACGQQTPPSGTTSTPEDSAASSNPYAGGKSYPWSDRLDPAGSNPYANGRSFPWVGPMGASSLGKLATTTNFLSDLTWTSATNAWGPAEKDTSNGEQAAGDGHPITIGGQVYKKGLGVHANSELQYSLGGACTTFSAFVGVDAEVGARGSVVFQLWNGSSKLYDSGVVRGGDTPKQVNAPITGVQTLRLVVTDAGDGIDYDHADWGNAAVSCESSTPAAGTTQLSALNWQSASNGWGPVERNLSNGEQGAGDGKPLTLGGVVYPQGLGVHAASELTYTLGGNCSTFSAVVGIDAEVGSRGSVNFQLWNGAASAASTTMLYDSGVRRGGDSPKTVSVPITGVQTLRLVVTNGGDNIDYDHADWADAKVICGTVAGTPPSGLTVENLDGFPAPDRMVFSRIQSQSGQYVMHERGTLRLRNSGTVPLTLTGLPIDPSWTVDPPQTFPQQLASGQSLDVGIRFQVDQSGNLPQRLYTGTLTINSNDANTPVIKVQLAGLWQPASETYGPNNAYAEPSLDQVRQAFGWSFNLYTAVDAAPPTNLNDGSNVPINQRGAVRPQGDEVMSAYWSAADSAQPVNVRQVGAWSQQMNTSTLGWYPKGRADLVSTVFVRAAYSAQTVFPVAPNATTPGVSGIFTPAGVFGLNVDGFEYSDSTLNDQTVDRNHGCVNLCGQHLRFWPLTGASGAVVPNAYVMVVDYGGYNDDYQDEVYVVRNVKPASVLLKVGASDTTYVGMDGRVWLPDRLNNGDVYFNPSGAVDEPAQAYSGAISNTTDAGLYRSYRGNVGNVPQNQRSMTFEVPINNGMYTLKLHFVDLAHSTAGQRIFDVLVNGVMRLPGLDIVAAAGGGQRALVEQLDGVQVSNGKVVVTMNASVDYPALSAIEIVR